MSQKQVNEKNAPPQEHEFQEDRSDNELLFDSKKTLPEKVVIPFRDRKAVDQSSVSILSPLAVPVLRCEDQATKSKIPAAHNLLAPFCENAEPVARELIGTSFRIFKDAIGECWRCNMPLTCDHAIVMHGTMHSCRVRSREIHEIQEAQAGRS